ncbi:MAG: hypothetical protein HFF39_07505 [Lawsonibacter sp.]|nr:hypothetical protein [Lawsonibacter sp.]
MGSFSISGTGPSAVWYGCGPQKQTASGQGPSPDGPSAQTDSWQTYSSRQEEKGPSIAEMLKQAREKAAEARERLKVPKNSARYGDAPMMAYARLARAKSKPEVSAATGYARRQIAQLKTAMRQDPENAERIRAAINQLQKAVSRGNKKKKDLDREKLMESRRARAQREENLRKAQHLKLELRRRQAMRAIRESGYLREADVDNKLQDHLAATRMELRAQAQGLAAAAAPSVEAAVQQYAAQAAPAPAETAGIDVQA